MAKPLVWFSALRIAFLSYQIQGPFCPWVWHDYRKYYDILLIISELSHYGGHQLESSGRRAIIYPTTEALQKNLDIFRNIIKILYCYPLKLICR